MEVKVASLYTDVATDVQRMVEVTLTSQEGKRFFKDKWDKMSIPTQFEKLSALADVLMHKYAADRNLRSTEKVNEDIHELVNRFLK